MKKLLFLCWILVLLPTALAIPASQVLLDSFVNDYTNTLSQSEIQTIEQIGADLYTKELAEYAVVIVDSMEGQAIESYSLEIAQGNLGQTDKNNGLLLLVALQEREYRFEVGRGIEADLTDAFTGQVGRQILVPNFQNQSYGKGIVEASVVIRDRLSGNETEATRSLYSNQQQTAEWQNFIGIIIFVIIFIVLFSVRGKKGKRMDGDGYFFAALAASSLLRGGGGNFGGFGGGGSFGGGGAGGGW